ncbi:MAG: DNA polymerase Y family protein, partial [Aquabacterium sp.]
DHRPEQAMARPAFVLDGSAAAAADVPPAALARPVWLLPQPQPLPERAHQPWLDGGPLQLAAGPERLEAGWWDGSGAARDYFVAVAGDGTLVWVFRERLPPAEGGGWYLHGRFA